MRVGRALEVAADAGRDNHNGMPHALIAPTLPISEGVWLRPWKPEDAPSLARACDDPEIARWVRVASPYTLEAAREYLGVVAGWWRDGEVCSLAIADRMTILGAVSIRVSGKQPSIGYWLARSARGRGLATRAVEAVAKWASSALGLPEVWIFAQPANVVSCRVALRAGFVEQAERVVFPDGKPRSVFRRSVQLAGPSPGDGSRTAG